MYWMYKPLPIRHPSACGAEPRAAFGFWTEPRVTRRFVPLEGADGADAPTEPQLAHLLAKCRVNTTWTTIVFCLGEAT